MPDHPTQFADIDSIEPDRSAEHLHARSGVSAVHVIWLSAGLGCDGESLALTAATSPSLEDLLSQAIPGAPSIVLHNPVYAYEVGEDFIRGLRDAENGLLGSFVLVLEGAIGNERINGVGHWSGLGVDPETGQPITINEWIDRLAPEAAAVIALGPARHTAVCRRCAATPRARWACPTISAGSGRASAAFRSCAYPGAPPSPTTSPMCCSLSSFTSWASRRHPSSTPSANRR